MDCSPRTIFGGILTRNSPATVVIVLRSYFCCSFAFLLVICLAYVFVLSALLCIMANFDDHDNDQLGILVCNLYLLSIYGLNFTY